jgi:hypothetical protein
VGIFKKLRLKMKRNKDKKFMKNLIWSDIEHASKIKLKRNLSENKLKIEIEIESYLSNKNIILTKKLSDEVLLNSILSK